MVLLRRLNVSVTWDVLHRVSYKKSELMLMRRARAYGSSGLQLISLAAFDGPAPKTPIDAKISQISLAEAAL